MNVNDTYPQGLRPRLTTDPFGRTVVDPASMVRGDGGSLLFAFASPNGVKLCPVPAQQADEIMNGPDQNWYRSIRPRLATDEELAAWLLDQKTRAEAAALAAVQEAKRRAEGARLAELEEFARKANLEELRGAGGQ